MNRVAWTVTGIAVVTAAVLLAGAARRNRVEAQWRPVGPGPERVVEVPRGAGVAQISEILQREGVVRDARAFRYGLERWALEGKLQAGYYRLSPAMSAEEVARTIASGKVATIRWTVPEGLTVEQIAQRAAETDLCTAKEFLAAARPDAVRARGFDPKKAGFDLPRGTLEGYLFPETYSLQYGWGAGEIVEAMLAQFQRSVVQGLADDLRAGGKPLHLIITVASLIEREARIEKDRAPIASVIYNRLNRGMRLQIDATVLYALGHHKARVLYRDLEVDSPYNTYRHAGLPPGPIASPGLASIKAALHPARTEYLYYVARKDGGHVFTRTPEEHVAARRLVRAEAAGLRTAAQDSPSATAGR